MKKYISFGVLLILLAMVLMGCGGNDLSKEEISDLVSKAIISENENSYTDEECCGEGHEILGSKISGNRLKVYALTMVGNYGFQNDMFIKVSGSGVIPAVFHFEKSGDQYKLVEIEYPEDGGGYTKSIKKMFPLKYRNKALHYGADVEEKMKEQERTYAQAYLNSIGRDAKIGEYRDLYVKLLTDCGVSVEVSNALIEDKRLWKYPYWIGSKETLEDGIRYIHTLSIDKEKNTINYVTKEYESGKVIESFVFDAETGEEYVEKAVVDWNSIYGKLLDGLREKYKDNSYPGDYTLYDVDKDGVPELFVKHGNCEADFSYGLYKIPPGSQTGILVGSFHGGHSSICGLHEKNAFLVHYGQMGVEVLTKVTMTGRTLVEEVVFNDEVEEYHQTESLPYHYLDDRSGLVWDGNPEENNQAILDSIMNG